jgi:hypothetical protein
MPETNAANPASQVPEGTKPDGSTVKVDETKTTTPSQIEKPEANATPKTELTVTDIFTQMKEQTVKMKGARDAISNIRTKIGQLRKRQNEIQKALKATGRVASKISVLGKKKTRIGEEDRLIQKAEKEFIKNELILLNEQKWIKMNELKVLVGSNMKSSRKSQIQNKAMSSSYIARNRWSIEERLLATLNGVIEGTEDKYRDRLLILQKESQRIPEKDYKEFNKELEDFLDEVDVETYILCSHNLKEPLYKAITLTLRAWSGKGKIEKLIFPEEDNKQKESVPGKEDDPSEAASAADLDSSGN